jgi:hypothetical protein
MPLTPELLDELLKDYKSLDDLQAAKPLSYRTHFQNPAFLNFNIHSCAIYATEMRIAD